MIITVPDTNATGIHMALVKARHNIGVASSMVFTMIVVADLRHYDAALEACQNAGREHPSRIILVTNGQAKADRVDAEIRLGEEVPGEVISLRFHGQLTEHRDSVVLPLLLPDSPVVAWWPAGAPGRKPKRRRRGRRQTKPRSASACSRSKCCPPTRHGLPGGARPRPWARGRMRFICGWPWRTIGCGRWKVRRRPLRAASKPPSPMAGSWTPIFWSAAPMPCGPPY